LTLELNPPIKEFSDLGFTQQLLDVFEKLITDEQALVKKLNKTIKLLDYLISIFSILLNQSAQVH